MGTYDLTFGSTRVMWEVPSPAEMRLGRDGYFEDMKFENGGGVTARSKPFQQTIDLVYPWYESNASPSVDRFHEMAAGEWGDDLLWLNNPMAYDFNVFPRNWASPGICEQGWPIIGHAAPTYADTASNAWRQPYRKATYTITTAANATPLTDASIPYVILPISSGYTTWVGATGVATGTAVVKLEVWLSGAAAAASSTSLVLQSETGSTRMAGASASWSSADGSYLKVFLTRTSAAASTITPISLFAQQWLTGVTPPFTGYHVRGQGFNGLRFNGQFGESWTDASSGRHYKAASVPLIEVGGWE